MVYVRYKSKFLEINANQELGTNLIPYKICHEAFGEFLKTNRYGVFFQQSYKLKARYKVKAECLFFQVYQNFQNDFLYTYPSDSNRYIIS